MSIPLTCPNGHELFAYETQAGTQMRCPKCLALADVPGAPTDDGLDLGEKPTIPTLMAPPKPKRTTKDKAKRARRAAQLGAVRRGLAGHAVRFVLLMSVPFLHTVARVVGLFGAPIRSAVPIVSLVLCLAAPAFGIVGSTLCLRQPRKKGKNLLIASIVLDALLLTVAVVRTAVLAEDEGDAAWELMQFGLVATAWVVLVIYLRGLADYLGEWGYAQQTIGLLGLGATLIVVPTLVLFALTLAASLLGGIVALSATILLAFLLVPFWMFYFRFVRLNLELMLGLRAAIVRDGREA